MKPQEALTFFHRINKASSLKELRKINLGLFFFFFSFKNLPQFSYYPTKRTIDFQIPRFKP